MAQKKALGRGLGALIGPSNNPKGLGSSAEVTEAERKHVRDLGLDEIVASPFQPRKQFKEGSNNELVESIRQHGIIQPLIVRQRGTRYELIAGERRWRAARQAGLETCPAVVREATDLEVLEMALIENLQREDLNPIEEAQAYQRLARDFRLTQEQIAQKVGKSRAAVANALRLLDLDPEVSEWLAQGRLSVGHAKVLLAIKDAEEQQMLAGQVLRAGLTVRETEKLVARHLKSKEDPNSSASPNGTGSGKSSGNSLPPSLQNVRNKIRHRLGTEVNIQHSAKKGRIEIAYYGNDDLNRILELLKLND